MNKGLLLIFISVFSFSLAVTSIIAPKSYAAVVSTPDECLPDPEDCEDLKHVYVPGSSTFAQTQVAGSLLGVANYAQGTVVNEPIPVNMAYWWNDNVNRIPFAGQAMAAEISYSGPLLRIVMGVWKLSRNIAYGVMSLVMLATGFMIITRKKIGAQAAVTVQMALPRIIIALILITFSYPIGAVGASAAFVLRGNTDEIVNGINWGDIGESMESPIGEIVCDTEKILFEKIRSFVPDLSIIRTTLNHTVSFIIEASLFSATGKNPTQLAQCGVYFLEQYGTDKPFSFQEASAGELAAVLFALNQGLMGIGPFVLLITIFVFIAAVVMWILVLLKVILIYLKILFSIIGAPLVFAFGAVPGNETMTVNWFKTFIANVISIPVAWFIFGVSWAVTMKAILVAVVEASWIGGGLLMLLIIPFLFLYGANLARTIPNKIQDAIVGAKKK